MKCLFLIVTLNITATLPVFCQQGLSNNEKAVQQAVKNMFEALSNRDSIALKEYCAKDMLLFEYGQQWTLDTLIRKAITLNTAIDFKRTNSFDFIATQVDQKMAWVSYYLQSVIATQDKKTTLRWVETVVLVNEDKKWKLKVLHSTLISRE